MRNHPLVLLVVLSTSGCFAAYPAAGEAPGPRGDPEVVRAPLAFEGGVLVADRVAPAAVLEVEGYPSSVSDDGDWLVTCHWSDATRRSITARITHLPSNTATGFVIDEVLYSCPVISGDGDTLAYFTSRDGAGAVWLVDRASLSPFVLFEGNVGPPAISDDGRRIAFRACAAPRPACDAEVHFIDLDTGSHAIVPEERRPQTIVEGITMSGDGRQVLSSGMLEPSLDRRIATRISADGETTQPIDNTGTFGRVGLSDDGRVLVGTRASTTSEWAFDAPDPILDLGVEVDGVYVPLGGEGPPTAPVDALALSGDGATLVFRGLTTGLVRTHLPDGRTQTIPLDCEGITVAPPVVDDAGTVVAVGVFLCPGDPPREPHDRTRVHRLPAW